MPTVREYEAAMERNPSDTEAFVALRKAYRQSQKHDRLVTLYEARAQAIEDNAKAGELFYLAAELRIDQLGDAEGAEADLVNAVDRDPSHIRAAARLKDIYREQGRTADYMTMLEMEAAAVARTRDPARIAELEAEMSQLFLNHFARLERAVRNPQKTGKLAQEHVRSIESARKIYRALGDYRAVVRLYELELEGTQDARRRADLLLGLGRVLGEKLEELDAAAQRLAEVVRLRPRDEKALELLAGVYANPNWIGADGVDRAAAIYYQIARRRQEASDTENAIAALRRALAAVPGHAESSELLERVYYDARRFQELDRYYRERIGGRDGRSRAHRLPLQARPAGGGRARGRGRGAARLQRDLADRAGGRARVARSWSSCTWRARSTPSSPSCASASWARSRTRSSGRAVMLELAALYRDRLGDRDQAAVYLHAVLEIEPENQMALGAYAEHFREKGDWAALADLLEFSFERARLAGIGNDELLPRLEEIATVSEKQLGDAERAIAAWQRAEEIAPDVRPRARGAAAPAAQEQELGPAGGAARARGGRDGRTRDRAPRSCGAPRRSTARSWARPRARSRSTRTSSRPIRRTRCRCAPSSRPTSARATSSAWRQLLREQIERAGTKQERVGLLRRVLVICDERTGDLAQGQWAANEILHGGAGRSRHADAPGTDPRARRQPARAGARARSAHQTRGQPRREAADPAPHRRHPARPAAGPGRRGERLEEVVRLDPDDGKALGTLVEVYSALNRCEDLARDPRPPGRARRRRSGAAGGVPAPAGAAGRGPAARPGTGAPHLGGAARICCPPTREALESLARISNSQADWITLVRILERQMPLAEEPGRAADIGLQRAQIFDEQLHDTDAAALALEQLIAEIDPRNIVAHERLRTYYEADEDWPRVVKVAERQLFLTEDPGAARAARDGAGRAGPRQARRRQEGDHDLRARAGDGRRQPGGAARGRRPLRQDRRSPAAGLRRREAAGTRDRPRRAPRADAADRHAVRDPSGRCGARPSSGTGAPTWRRPTPRACSWSIRRPSATACSRS